MLSDFEILALRKLYESRSFLASKPGEVVRLANPGGVTHGMLAEIAHRTEFHARLPQDYQLGNPLPTVIIMEYAPVL